jgi:hypothetical protein
MAAAALRTAGQLHVDARLHCHGRGLPGYHSAGARLWGGSNE